MEKQSKKELLAAYKERAIIGGVYAIKNTANGKILLQSAADLYGCKNRFEFAQKTGGCAALQLHEDWKIFGAVAFTFEILEQLEKKDTQTLKEFSQDIEVLKEIWLEKLAAIELY